MDKQNMDKQSADMQNADKQEAPVQEAKRRVPNSISSSISGPDAIGDDVAAKRANLLGAQSTPQLGRREAPEPYDPWPKRKMYMRGMLFGAVVIIAVLVVTIFLGSNSTIG